MDPTQNGQTHAHRPATRVRSQETKYCRIPQWLYETGISLQSISTYGWLHGRYGHFDRVMPSYNRLAKELGVSRGSVIAYVKELVAVGAIRVATSGAAGRQTNEYVIAFNEPFQVATGQHTDRVVVSPLTSTGQHSDPGGQRAVQEEDVVKKTNKKTKKTSSSSSVPPSPSAAVERVPEGGGGGDLIDHQQQDERHAEAVEFLRALPAPWAVGRKTAEQLAPLLLAVVVDGGWQLDEELAAKLTENPGGIHSYRAVLPGRIEELPRRTRPQAPASSGHRPFQPPADHSVYQNGFHTPALPAARPAWCGDPDCSETDRMRDVELDNGLRAVRPCPDCHPDAVAATTPLPGTDTTVAGWAQVAAQLASGPLPGTDSRVAGWLALPTGGVTGVWGDSHHAV